jgi:chromate transporter
MEVIFSLFLTFVVLGFFSFGGGYAFLPLMQDELVIRQQLLTREQFVLALTAGQISPGPVAVAGSFAGFLIGYDIYGTFLAGIAIGFIAWVGTNVATVISMGLLMRVFDRISDHPAIARILEFVFPVVTGLILYLAFDMGRLIVENIRAGLLMTFPQVLIIAISFVLAYTRKVDYAFIIIGAGVIGYFFL